jgi:lipopolysaccharide/colanic/teichoic acid biosynthesis glycosyltransferase
MFKRVFDLVSALVGLLVFGLPMLAVAAWIRLDSPGPVFFRQERVGRHGKRFRIHKFRTMTVDAEQRGPQLTVGADARVTRVGRVLRANRLDELPQFLDVLAGDMSLVGPRPDVPRYVDQWPADLRERVLAEVPRRGHAARAGGRSRARIHGRHPASQARPGRRLRRPRLAVDRPGRDRPQRRRPAVPLNPFR